METYIFFRVMDGAKKFYSVVLMDDNDARANAECNPGTTRVERVNGDVVWVAPESVN